MTKPLNDAEIEQIRGWTAFTPAPILASLVMRLVDEVERARALLRRIEWNAGGDVEGSMCPGCFGGDPADKYGTATGHKPDCELAALIGKVGLTMGSRYGV